MKKSIRLRKGIVKEAINRFEYLVEDVFDDEIIRMTLPGKMVMNYLRLSTGEEVYVMVSPVEPNKGQLATMTTFKMDNDLYGQKLELDKKHKKQN